MANIRTWSQIMDQAFPDYSAAQNCGASFLFLVKNNLQTAGWVLTGSSDGNPSDGAGMDGVDRIGTSFNNSLFVWNGEGYNRTWFVLRHPTLHYSVMFQCNNAAPYYYFSFAKTEYTGGSVTNVPSSVDSVSVTNQRFIYGGTTLHRVSMLYNTLGEFLFICIRSGVIGGPEHAVGLFQIIDPSTNPVDPWPMIGLSSYLVGSSGVGAWGALGAQPLITGNMLACRTGNGFIANYAGPNPLTIPYVAYTPIGWIYSQENAAGGTTRNSWIARPLELWIIDPASPYNHTDYKGSLADIELSFSETLPQGFTFGSPISRVLLGSMWLPFTIAPSFI